MNKTTTNIAAGAIAALALSLTGCGDTGPDGTYWSYDKQSDGELHKLVVDGSDVTDYAMECDHHDESDGVSHGKLSADNKTLTWTTKGSDFEDSDPFSLSKDGSIVTLDDGDTNRIYHRDGTDAAKTVQNCHD